MRRDATSWWWAGVFGVVVLVIPVGIALVVGPSRVLGIPAIVIGVLGVVGFMADLWQAETLSPPEAVQRAMKQATVGQRMAAMRAARRNHAYPGPLEDAVEWHRERLAERRRRRPWAGHGLLALIATSPALQLSTRQPGTGDWSVFAALGSCVLLMLIVALAVARPPHQGRPSGSDGSTTVA